MKKVKYIVNRINGKEVEILGIFTSKLQARKEAERLSKELDDKIFVDISENGRIANLYTYEPTERLNEVL